MSGCCICTKDGAAKKKCGLSLQAYGWWTLGFILLGVAASCLDTYNVFNLTDTAEKSAECGITWLGGITLGLGGAAFVTGMLTLNLRHGGKCSSLCMGRAMLMIGISALMILPTLLGHHCDVTNVMDVFSDPHALYLYPAGSLIATGLFFLDTTSSKESGTKGELDVKPNNKISPNKKSGGRLRQNTPHPGKARNSISSLQREISGSHSEALESPQEEHTSSPAEQEPMDTGNHKGLENQSFMLQAQLSQEHQKSENGTMQSGEHDEPSPQSARPSKPKSSANVTQKFDKELLDKYNDGLWFWNDQCVVVCSAYDGKLQVIIANGEERMVNPSEVTELKF